jgi:hypothetical protein
MSTGFANVACERNCWRERCREAREILEKWDVEQGPEPIVEAIQILSNGGKFEKNGSSIRSVRRIHV